MLARLRRQARHMAPDEKFTLTPQEWLALRRELEAQLSVPVTEYPQETRQVFGHEIEINRA